MILNRWKSWGRALDKKILITSFTRRDVQLELCALVEGNRVLEMRVKPKEKEELLTNIYLGQVQRVQPFMNCVFVDIRQHMPCFLPMGEQALAYVPHGQPGRPLKAMDEVVVQVTKEASRQKNPCVTAKLSLQGDYMVLQRGKGGVGISQKLGKKERERLRAFANGLILPENTCLTLRTAAQGISEEELERDFLTIKASYEELMLKADTRPVFTLLREAEPFYLPFIREYAGQITEIKTDNDDIWEKLGSYVSERDGMPPVILYKDRLLPLYKLYRLETVLDGALMPKVWLKSGGFLMIEQTEAFVSIDVNSGKYSSKKDAQDTYRKINREAAGEIAAQLRLRNLSGMILIDFINLEEEKDRQELLELLEEMVKDDPVPTRVIDITALGIVEITRKKIRKPLAEQVKVV